MDYFPRKSLSKYLTDTTDFNKQDIDIFINDKWRKYAGGHIGRIFRITRRLDQWESEVNLHKATSWPESASNASRVHLYQDQYLFISSTLNCTVSCIDIDSFVVFFKIFNKFLYLLVFNISWERCPEVDQATTHCRVQLHRCDACRHATLLTSTSSQHPYTSAALNPLPEYWKGIVNFLDKLVKYKD